MRNTMKLVLFVLTFCMLFTVFAAFAVSAIPIAPVDITITSASAEKVYDGTPLTKELYTFGSIDDPQQLKPDHYISVTFTGTQTGVGESDNTFEVRIYSNVDGLDHTNEYNITEKYGKLTVRGVAITVAPTDKTVTYNGQTQYPDADGYTYTGDLAEGDTVVATLTGSALTGTDTIAVSSVKIMRGDTDVSANYDITSTATATLTVNKLATRLGIETDTWQKSYDGTAKSGAGYTVTAGEILTGDTLVPDYTNTPSVTHVADGKKQNVQSFKVINDATGIDVTDQYDPQVTYGYIEITPVSITLAPAAQKRDYKGSVYTAADLLTGNKLPGELYTVVSGAFAGSEGVATVTFKNIDIITKYVGVYENAVEFEAYTLKDNTDARDYVITLAKGNITIDKVSVAVTFTSADASKQYDGTALTKETDPTIGATALLEGDYAVFTFTGTITNFGSVQNKYTVKIFNDYTDADNNTVKVDVTENYNLTTLYGTLSIDKKELTIKSASDTKAYDGTALTNGSYTILDSDSNEYTFPANEGINIEVTGSCKYVGTYDNTFTYAVTSDPDNYSITPVYGILKITPTGHALTFTLSNVTKEYDGTAYAYSASDWTHSALICEDDVLTVTFTTTDKNAGEKTVGIESVTVMNGIHDVTDCYDFDISALTATVTITKKELRVITPDATKVYDGTPLNTYGRENEVTYEGFIDGEGVAEGGITLSGSITYIVKNADGSITDSVKNEVTLTPKAGTDLNNYNIVYVQGTLKLTPAPLVIITGSTTQEYSGAKVVNHYYDIHSGLISGDYIRVKFNDVAKHVGSYKNTITVEATKPLGDHDLDITPSYVLMEQYENAENETVDAFGTLLVTERRINITAASIVRIFTGSEIVIAYNNEAGSYTLDNAFVEGEGISELKIDAKALFVGSYAAKVTITVTDDTKAEDYIITVNGVNAVEGVYTCNDLFKVNQVDTLPELVITVTGLDENNNPVAIPGTFVYDGQTHIYNNVTYTGLFEGAVVAVEANAEIITGQDKVFHVGTYKFKANIDGLSITATYGGETRDITDYFNITTTTSTLEVTKRDLLVVAVPSENSSLVNYTHDETTNFASRPYNGRAITLDDLSYEVFGLQGEDVMTGLDHYIYGTATLATTIFNGDTVEVYVAGDSFENYTNYNFEFVPLDITITQANIVLAPKSNQTATYDGQFHMPMFSFEGENIPFGDVIVADPIGSFTAVKELYATSTVKYGNIRVMHGDRDVTENYVFGNGATTTFEFSVKVVAAVEDMYLDITTDLKAMFVANKATVQKFGIDKLFVRFKLSTGTVVDVTGTVQADGTALFVLDKIGPALIGSDVEATLFCDNVAGETKTVSIRGYLNEVFDMVTDTKLKTVVANLLAYGETAANATDWLTDEQTALLITPDVAAYGTYTLDAAPATTLVTITGAKVTASSDVTIEISYNGNVEGMKCEVNGLTGVNVEVEDGKVIIKNISATQFTKEYTVVFTNAEGTAISKTLTHSIAKFTNGTNSATKSVFVKLIAYGLAAEAYAA